MLDHHRPDQLALLRDKPELIPCAVDVELSGVRIPAGTTVVVPHYCANRDEALLAEPDRLDVTRPAHLAFGHGVRRAAAAPARAAPSGTRVGTDRELGVLTVGPRALPVTW